MKDHEIRELVDQLWGIAANFGSTQQCRDRIANAVVPALTKMRAERNQALLDAERARDERNRVGVEIRRELLTSRNAVLEEAAKAIEDDPFCRGPSAIRALMEKA